MPMTALVTAQTTDLGARPRPDWRPLLRVAADRPAVTFDGVAVTTEPVEMVDDGSGVLSADLIVTDEFTSAVRYVPTVDWLSPTGETNLRVTLPVFIVPPDGGNIGELALVPTSWGLAWEGSTPPTSSMLWLYVDPDYDPASGDPLPTYTTQNGEVIEHGELVEWQAGAKQGAIKRLGNLRGPQGPRGVKGLDGDPNAVADFGAALGSVIADPATEAHESVGGVIASRAPSVVTEQLRTPGTDFREAVEDTVHAAGDARYPLRSTSERIAGNWTFSRGQTTDEDRVRLAIERDFDVAAGDKYTGTTRSEFRVGSQQDTSQNPPAYPMSEWVLIDEGHPDPNYNGEVAYVRLIGNRLLTNQRVEVNMGKGARATLRSGSTVEEELIRLQFHNYTLPHLSIYGPNNPGPQNEMRLDGAWLQVRPPAGAADAQVWTTTSGDGSTQQMNLKQYPAGHQMLRARYAGVDFGTIRWEPLDHSLRLYSPGGIHLGPGTQFEASAGPILTDSSGIQWRLGVSTVGATIWTKVS